MKYRLVVRPEAEIDIQEAHQWYEARRTGLGRSYVDEIEAAFRRVQERPLSFRRAHQELRRAFARRFPYVVYFLVEGDTVFVKGVLHQRRKPSTWQARSRV